MEVYCNPYGLLGVIAQAHLGLTLFEEHKKEMKNCIDGKITPVNKDIVWLQRFQIRRAQRSGKK